MSIGIHRFVKQIRVGYGMARFGYGAFRAAGGVLECERLGDATALARAGVSGGAVAGDRDSGADAAELSGGGAGAGAKNAASG